MLKGKRKDLKQNKGWKGLFFDLTERKIDLKAEVFKQNAERKFAALLQTTENADRRAVHHRTQNLISRAALSPGVKQVVYVYAKYRNNLYALIELLEYLY